MVYIYDDMVSFDDACLEQALSMISVQRREQVLKFRHKSQQKQSIIAYLLLKYALEREHHLSTNPIFDFTEKGKPYLAEHPEIHFNVSHCASGVACIVGAEPAGIDIECVESYKPDLAAYISSPEELDEIQRTDNKAESFTRLWTKKESYLKCIGTGITNNLKEIFSQPVPYHFETLIHKDKIYVCTYCTQKATPKEVIFVNEIL